MVPRFNVINLARQRWQTSTGDYLSAVQAATKLEIATGQLHGVERA